MGYRCHLDVAHFRECRRLRGRQMPDNGPNHASLRIAGFGACMITGYPHDSGGFFDIACTHIAQDLACSVESRIFSFGGFPAPRAEKYLEPKVISYAPNYIIIQFGCLDALCPVRRSSLSVRGASGTHLGSRSHPGKSDNRNLQRRPATRWSWLRWELASLLGYLRRLEPITPLPAYLPVMERMIDSCIAADITPVVLTPFVYGSRYSMRNGVAYAHALRELIADKSGVVLVDCIEALRVHPKRAVLQHDGFHLSRNGHAIVGLAIAQRIISHVQRRQNKQDFGGPLGVQHTGGTAKLPWVALGRAKKNLSRFGSNKETDQEAS